MATFFVLPPRELLEHAVGEFLARLLPGLPLATVVDEWLANVAAADTFVVHREDLPDGDAPAALAEAFGAEPGDRVVEIGPPRTGGVSAVRETVVPDYSAAR